ncbi:MAG: acyltransferase [Deltaproteobacteria bacterium]|nr:acyltransferase [Deltaproteobacteria bacterium]
MDALRGIAAISVAWFHFTQNGGMLGDGWVKAISAYGWLGVEVFFVISGFILPHALHQGSYKLRDYPRFIARRLIRLEPPYLASLAVAIALGYATNLVPGFRGRQFETSASDVLLHVGYLAPLFGVEWIVPAYWSLAIEFQYYLLIGLVFPAISHTRPIVRVAGFAFLSALCVTVPSQLCVSHWIPLFALGIIVYQLRVGLLPPRIFPAVLAIAACAAWLKLGILVALVGTASAVAIAYLQLRSPLACWLGDVSYSLYLLHVPLGERVALASRRIANAHGIAASVVALLVSLAGAYLLNRLVEEPAQRAAAGLRYAGGGGRYSAGQTASDSPAVLQHG